MNTTKKHIIEQTKLRSGSTFLFPEIETIEDFVDAVWRPDSGTAPKGASGYRGNRAVAPERDYFFLGLPERRPQPDADAACRSRWLDVPSAGLCADEAVKLMVDNRI